MGWMQDKAGQADEMYRAVITPLLAPNEPLVGVFQATQSKTFSSRIFVIGVMPQRFVMVEVDRKFQPKATPVVVFPNDVVKSSIDGFGGGLAHFLTTDVGEFRFDTANDSYRLVALGGGLDNVITGEGQVSGKQAFMEFLARARGIR